MRSLVNSLYANNKRKILLDSVEPKVRGHISDITGHDFFGSAASFVIHGVKRKLGIC